MYICICRQVTDNQIKAAVADGKCSLKDLREHLSLGSQCGKCCKCAKELLNDLLEKSKESVEQ